MFTQKMYNPTNFEIMTKIGKNCKFINFSVDNVY
jgi:hypothetical protein